MPGLAYFKIARQVAFWLSHVPQCKIKSSTKSIVDSLNGVKLEDDEELVSFNVVSLYTNMPVKEAIQIAADLLYNGKNCDVIMLTHNGFCKQIDPSTSSCQCMDGSV